MEQQVGKYQLIRKLAVGGMAEVYLAKAEGPMGFAKTLVLKRILPHLAEDQSFVDMFLGEAKLAAQLNHPNVVQIFDFGEADGQYYIAMEYIDGPNLRALSKRANEVGHKIGYTLAAKTISFACEGLSYAHDFCDPETGEPFNLIHRDISPDNILLSKNGGVKVVDFGIAKAAGQGHHTKTGTLKGKLAYMPPEQLSAKPLDRRVDIFALGIVLYELVTGDKPFDSSSEVSIMRAILYEPLTPAAAKRADIPPLLSKILDKALAKDRDQRYGSCRELQADLERFILSTGEAVGSYQLQQLVATLATQGGNPHQTPPPGSGPKSRPGAGSNPNIPGPRTNSSSGVRATGSAPRSNPNPRAPQAPPTVENVAVPTEMTRPLTSSQPNAPAVPPPSPTTHRLPMIIGGTVAVIALGVGAMLYVKSTQGPQPLPPLSETELSAQQTAEQKVEPEKKPELPKVVEAPAVPDAGMLVAEAKTEEPPAETPTAKTKKDLRKKNMRGGATTLAAAKNDAKSTTIVAKLETTKTDVRSSQNAMASFEVVSDPPGQVRVNGKFVGASGSARVSNLPPGDVKVEVYDSRAGFSKTQTFTVGAGDNGVKKIVVAKGSLEIRIRPYATVYLDGKLIGETPVPAQTVFEGKHELKLVNRDLKYEKSFDIVVRPGQTTPFKKNLEESD